MKCISFSMAAKCFVIFLIGSLMLFSCKPPKKELKVITVTGCEYVINLKYRDILWSFGSKVGTGDTNALLVSDGDLLNGDDHLYLVYDNDYGDHLDFVEDTTEQGTIRVNGRRHWLYLENDPEIQEWISKLNPDELAEYEFLYVEGDTGMYLRESVRMIAGSNPNIGLLVENQKLMDYVLPMLHPSVFVSSIGNDFDSRISNFTDNLDKVELLSLFLEDLDSLDFLYQLPNLRTLMISSEDSVGNDLIQVERIPNLESLSISGVEMTSLEALGNPVQLSELYLESGPLTDISQLREMKGLQRLGLRYCDTMCDLSVLKEIDPLKWLAVPVYMSQAEFGELVVHHKSLEGIELIEGEYITDFSPLTQLDNLKALSFSVPAIDYESLKQLNAIDLIVIDEDNFDEDSVEIAALKETLPGTHIVPGGGFCMGSGWILLLLPVLMLAFVLRRFTGK